MEHSSAWKADSRSAGQEIPFALQNRNSVYRVHKNTISSNTNNTNGL
jgi:hypothetical protein